MVSEMWLASVTFENICNGKFYRNKKELCSEIIYCWFLSDAITKEL